MALKRGYHRRWYGLDIEKAGLPFRQCDWYFATDIETMYFVHEEEFISLSGTSGDSGTSGTSGDSGTSGTSGDSGTSGTSGTSAIPESPKWDDLRVPVTSTKKVEVKNQLLQYF